MKDDPLILNLGNANHYRVAKAYLESFKGAICTIDIHKLRDQRTLSQNSFMHGVLFPRAARGYTAAWGITVSMLRAKELLKKRYLSREMCNPDTGEVIPGSEYVEHTSDLDVPQCSAFIENCIEFIQDKLNVKVPAPEEFEPVGA